MSTMSESQKRYTLAPLENIEGNKLPKEYFDVKDIIEEFEVRDDDVWLSSFPKSGTTWCQELIWLVANDLDYKAAQQPIEKRFPFLEFYPILKSRQEFAIQHNLNINTPKSIDILAENSLQVLEETSGKRFIKTHLHWSLLPREIRNGSKIPKIIHILRDPKQVATSYYHHATKIFPCFIGDISDFIELFMKGEIKFGGYFENVLSYWERRAMPNMLIITFEEMKKDLRSTIRKIAEFLQKSLTEDNIDELERHLSFEQMRTNKAVNKQHIINNENVEFMRKGEVDSFKEELNEELIQKLDTWVQEHAQGTGLPYELI